MPVTHAMFKGYWTDLSTSAAKCPCTYVCRDIYVRTAAYSLDCHGGAMIYRRLYETFQSLIEHRTESVTLMNHKLSLPNQHH